MMVHFRKKKQFREKQPPTTYTYVKQDLIESDLTEKFQLSDAVCMDETWYCSGGVGNKHITRDNQDFKLNPFQALVHMDIWTIIKASFVRHGCYTYVMSSFWYFQGQTFGVSSTRIGSCVRTASINLQSMSIQEDFSSIPTSPRSTSIDKG